MKEKRERKEDSCLVQALNCQLRVQNAPGPQGKNALKMGFIRPYCYHFELRVNRGCRLKTVFCVHRYLLKQMLRDVPGPLSGCSCASKSG